jgi:hypothetical protein
LSAFDFEEWLIARNADRWALFVAERRAAAAAERMTTATVALATKGVR